MGKPLQRGPKPFNAAPGISRHSTDPAPFPREKADNLVGLPERIGAQNDRFRLTNRHRTPSPSLFASLTSPETSKSNIERTERANRVLRVLAPLPPISLYPNRFRRYL